MTALSERRVDRSSLRVNQAFVSGLLILAFVLNSVPLVAFVGLVMLVGTAVPAWSLFKRIYQHILQPAGLIRPDVVTDNPEPHRFAQGLGGTFVMVALLALLVGQPLIGWALTWLVVGLAAANLFLGFCAGCFVYYQLNRWNVPGFRHGPIRKG